MLAGRKLKNLSCQICASSKWKSDFVLDQITHRLSNGTWFNDAIDKHATQALKLWYAMDIDY